MTVAGPAKHTVEVIGEPNRPSSVSITTATSGHTDNKKTGDIAAYVHCIPTVQNLSYEAEEPVD